MQSVTLGQQIHKSMNSDSNPTFKNGQILFGKINKLYPNQMAEVQIGNQKILANIEAPLQTGERYLLQVQQNIDNILLKVLDLPASSKVNGKETAKQIMSHLGVASSADGIELAEFLLKNQLPIKKDTFQLTMQWLKQVDSSKEGLVALKTMYLQHLPFIEDVFKALFTQAKGESFHGMLQQLLTNINSIDNQTETIKQLKGVLESLIVPKQGQIHEMGLQKLISYWLNPNNSADIKEGAVSLLQKTGFFSYQLFESYSGIDSQTLGANKEKVDMTMTGQKGVQILLDYKTALQTGNQSKAQELLQNFSDWLTGLKSGSGENNSPNKRLVDALSDFVNQNGEQVKQAKDVLAKQLLLYSQNQIDRQLLPNERAALQLLATESQTTDMTNSSVVSAQLKDIAKALGLQLEHVLANTQSFTSTQLKEELTTLKPLLLTLLHEQQPANVKELAEQIVNRITAQQIISQENGPLQNLLLTLPMNIGNYETDITLQWSGRKRKDGSIDPDYCRILFYLDLEKLKETVIDMQVQNRVIKISVLNEQSELIQDVATPFIHTLRNQLEAMDYKLSGVLFENTINEQIVENKKQLVYQAASSYNGVDIRI